MQYHTIVIVGLLKLCYITMYVAYIIHCIPPLGRPKLIQVGLNSSQGFVISKYIQTQAIVILI